MTGWRDMVLAEFPAQVARLSLVADPDGLLTEEGILLGLRERGFDLLQFDDPIEFRFEYESKYRANWDRGQTTDLVVALRSPARALDGLPHDLLMAGRKIAFDLTRVFPNFNYPVIAALGRSHYDALFAAQRQYSPGPLGASQTKDFVLLHVFEIEPKVIKHAAHLLHVLLRLHYQQLDLPALLRDRLVQLLRQSGGFAEWPLEQLVADRSAFFGFLQERWKIFVQGDAAEGQVHASPSVYGLQFAGPATLPFDHHDVRVYLDNLFNEGILQPVALAALETAAPPWAAAGILQNAHANLARRLEGLLGEVVSSLPTATAPYAGWLSFAQRWAELQAVRYALDSVSGDTDRRLQEVVGDMQVRFQAWMLERYGSLYNQPSDPPVMVHHIPRAMASRLAQGASQKLAFLLIDGISLGQWSVVRDIIRTQYPHLRIEQSAGFAWVPTLTSVSRQAAFSGQGPFYFPDTLSASGQEQIGWRRFWQKQGLASSDVFFAAGLTPAKLPALAADLEAGSHRVAGLLVNTVDDIMHGMCLGMSGMYGQVRQWAATGFLGELLHLLTERGWDVILASDHGNTEGRGLGVPSEGSLVETRGLRARIYGVADFRSQAAALFPAALAWPPVGLPPAYLPLLAGAGEAFTSKDEVVVSHGGATLEEVIVPVIVIKK